MNLQGLQYYNRTFGAWGTARLLAARATKREMTVTLPGFRFPVHLRPGTTDIPVYASILREKEYGFDVPGKVRVIIDAGANIGLTSLYFANRFPEARIVAIEPEEENFRMLRKNVQGYRSIVAIHAALWNEEGELSVGLPDASTGASGEWAFVTTEGGSGKRVKAITLRSLMDRFGMPHIDILKVDIEGAEVEVFGACDWADAVGCAMVETHDRFRPGCTEAVSGALRGFRRVTKADVSVYYAEK
jgi:FkbM family methyltransferase